jgi:hypothetical protein
MTAGKYHQIVVTTMCWVNFGEDAAVTATLGADFPLNPGVYLYLPTAALDFIAFIRDSDDGVIGIGQAEA